MVVGGGGGGGGGGVAGEREASETRAMCVLWRGGSLERQTAAATAGDDRARARERTSEERTTTTPTAPGAGGCAEQAVKEGLRPPGGARRAAPARKRGARSGRRTGRGSGRTRQRRVFQCCLIPILASCLVIAQAIVQAAADGVLRGVRRLVAFDRRAGERRHHRDGRPGGHLVAAVGGGRRGHRRVGRSEHAQLGAPPRRSRRAQRSQHRRGSGRVRQQGWRLQRPQHRRGSGHAKQRRVFRCSVIRTRAHRVACTRRRRRRRPRGRGARGRATCQHAGTWRLRFGANEAGDGLCFLGCVQPLEGIL